MGCCDAPGLMPIEEALDKLLSPIKPIQTTLSLPLAEALGYVLAEDILSPIFVPPFDNSPNANGLPGLIASFQKPIWPISSKISLV